MGLVNHVVPAERLMEEARAWAREILAMSPTAIKLAKASFNADTDHIKGIGSLGMSALALYYTTEEATEGHKAFIERRRPDFRAFPALAIIDDATVKCEPVQGPTGGNIPTADREHSIDRQPIATSRSARILAGEINASRHNRTRTPDAPSRHDFHIDPSSRHPLLRSTPFRCHRPH